METYVGLLRGINVSGRKIVPMGELKKLLDGLGLRQVTTLLNSGNVIFRSTPDRASGIERKIETAIVKAFGFEVKVLVFAIAEIESILAACPFDRKATDKDGKIYVTLLSEFTDEKSLSRMKPLPAQTDEFVVSGRAVYLLSRGGYSKTPYNNAFIEKTLGVDATTRNINTIERISEIGSGLG
jgi:uncharacterized protein (DUF1697 family)